MASPTSGLCSLIYPSGNFSPVSEPYSPTRQQYDRSGSTICAATEGAIIHRISSSKDERVATCVHPFATVRPAGHQRAHFGSALGYQSPAARYSPTHSGMTFSPSYTTEHPTAADQQCNSFIPVTQRDSLSIASGNRRTVGDLEHRPHAPEEMAGTPQCYYFESPGTVSHDRSGEAHVQEPQTSCSTRGQVKLPGAAAAVQDCFFPSHGQTPRFDSRSPGSPSQCYQSSQKECSPEDPRFRAHAHEKDAADAGTSDWNTRNCQDNSGVTAEVKHVQGSRPERAEQGSAPFAEVLGGHRQSASLLPVFTKDGEMITHGQRFGGEQPEASRRVQLGRSGRKPLWSGIEDSSSCFGRYKHSEPTDLDGWRQLARQAGIENQMLRERIQDCEKQIYTLQQLADRETARAEAQTKKQLTVEADYKASREEVLRLRHTLRMSQRGADLARGAVIGGSAGDCPREVYLMREALAEAAEYYAQLLEQNDALRVQVEWLRRALRREEKEPTRQLEGQTETEQPHGQLPEYCTETQWTPEDKTPRVAGRPRMDSLMEEMQAAEGKSFRSRASATSRPKSTSPPHTCGSGVRGSHERTESQCGASGAASKKRSSEAFTDWSSSEAPCDPNSSVDGSGPADPAPGTGDHDETVSGDTVEQDENKGPIKRLEQRIREYRTKAPGAMAAGAGDGCSRRCLA